MLPKFNRHDKIVVKNFTSLQQKSGKAFTRLLAKHALVVFNRIFKHGLQNVGVPIIQKIKTFVKTGILPVVHYKIGLVIA